MARRYPEAVHDFIRANVQGRTTKELADMVNAAFGLDFTESRMKCYKANHRLQSGTRCGIQAGLPTGTYPEEVFDYIMSNYRGCGPSEMTEKLNEQFGTQYRVMQIKGFYGRMKLDSGITGHFPKGHVSANKGKHECAAGCERTWFPADHTPWNHVLVGTIAKKTDGYLWKKIADDPKSGRFNWRQLHRLVWEEANGPVPDGYVLIFRDQNRENCRLENLVLVSRRELSAINHQKIKVETPEGMDSKVLLAKIKLRQMDIRRARKKGAANGKG